MKLLLIKNMNYEKTDLDLDMDHTCHIKNSTNSSIKFINKFNKIIIENSESIYIEIYKIITSIEINNCNNIFIKINNIIENIPLLPCIEIYKSSVYVIGNINLYKETLIISECSNLTHLELVE